MMQELSVTERYRMIQAKIEKAASGRSTFGKVQLIAVSKNHPAEQIKELCDAGVRVFGENRVQEMAAKQNKLADSNIEWHFIGHLQRNKVKQLLALSPVLIQSVDNEPLAKVLEKEAAKIQQTVSVLVEVNIGEEESKTGASIERAPELVRMIAATCPHLCVKGLMCVAPEKEDKEEVRPYFRKLKELAEKIEKEELPRVSMQELSMGMSGDFDVAIEEGATMVRVGTAIFGERDYSFNG